MAISAWRNTSKGISDFGKELRPDCTTEIMGNVFRIRFSTVKSEFSVVVDGDSFAKLANLMVKADPTKALKAFGSALQGDIPLQPADSRR